MAVHECGVDVVLEDDHVGVVDCAMGVVVEDEGCDGEDGTLLGDCVVRRGERGCVHDGSSDDDDGSDDGEVGVSTGSHGG